MQRPKSNKRLLKEVRKQIDDEIQKIPPELLEKERKRKTEMEKTMEAIKAEKKWLQTATPQEFAEWLMNQHDEYVQNINWKVSQNFLDGETPMDKEMIIVYMYNLFVLLYYREIENIPEEVVNIIKEKGYVELLCILNVLGYF